MGIVTSNLDRSDLREIYFPALERQMAHYSYLSPDKKWVLTAEMNPVWQRCRVVPFSGGAGMEIGPPGPCMSAAWSPDGQYIYLGSESGGRFHLWREHFPDGRPEQITSGVNEERGVAVAPDGLSLITSVSTRQDVVWIHDSKGDRALSTEGYADVTPPVFSPDGKRLYYLLRRNLDSPNELWRTEVDSGKSEVLTPGVSIRNFDVSPDEKRVVYSDSVSGEPSQTWIATLDRSAPPRKIGSDPIPPVLFGPNGELLFRLTEGAFYYIGAMAQDGSARRKALPPHVSDFGRVSPDRRFVTATLLLSDPERPPTVLLPLDGGAPIRICNTLCLPRWSADGRYIYLKIAEESPGAPHGKTVAIPLSQGEMAPHLTPELVGNPAGWANVPGVKIIERTPISPGPNPSTYAYIQSSTHANLYRVPLP